MIPAARHSWRLLVAIIQVAAFLAFAMPGFTHAHGGGQGAGHAHTIRADAAPHAHHGATAESGSHTGLAVAALAPDDAAGGSGQAPCCVGCCCHAFIPGPEVAGPPARAVARAPAPPAEVAYADLTPEALPEPPRPFV